MLTVNTIVRIGNRGVLFVIEYIGNRHIRVAACGEELNDAERNTAAKELEVEFGRTIISI